MGARPTSRNDFEIALICALRIEVDTVQTMFDVFWDENSYGRAHGDQNQYTVGSIGEHNVVLAYLPGMGKVSAASVASSMRPSFPNIKLALIVGVCGAVPKNPNTQHEVFLGDLVISTAIVQYDFGRQYPYAFEAKDTLTDLPSQQVRTFLNKLESYHHRQQLESRLEECLCEVERKLPDTRYPGASLDFLYESAYVHKHQPSQSSFICDECNNKPHRPCRDAVSMSCEELGCEVVKLVQRDREPDMLQFGTRSKPHIHFGRMASGDTVMKSGSHRDEIAASKAVVAFEMEGAGVWDAFPSIVIKGVCDYADSHKSKGWQPHAAAVAAAGMKALLLVWEAGRPAVERRLPSYLKRVLSTRNPVHGSSRPSPSISGGRNQRPEFGGSMAILERAKTMMAAFLIDKIQERLAGEHNSISHQGTGALTYFFCRASTQGLDDAISILRGLIFVLINEHRELLQYAVEPYVIHGKRLFDGSYGLQALFQILSRLAESLPQLFIVVDGLDECGHNCEEFLQLLLSRYNTFCCNVKWLITSRNSGHITQELEDRPEVVNTSLEDNSTHVTQAVYHYIDQKVDQLKSIKNYDESTSTEIAAYLRNNADGTFLWAALVCKELAKARNRAPRKTLAVLRSFPSGLAPLYTRMSQQMKDIDDTEDREFCTWILRVASLTFRPLHTTEYRFVVPAPSAFEGQADDVRDLIAEYIPFLTVQDGVVEFVHHSVREYLIEMSEMWPFDAQKIQHDHSKQTTILKAHQRCAAHLLELISLNSVPDICKLRHTGILHKEIGNSTIACHVKPHLQYACAHWIDHCTWQPSMVANFARSAEDDDMVVARISRFFGQDFLFWTEILSLTGSVSVGMAAITRLQTHWSRTKMDSGLYDVIHDAKRFIGHNRTILEVAPLQIYTSCLLFSPTEGRIRQNYQHRFRAAVELMSQPRTRWNSCLQILEGHQGSIESVQFSPSGSILASASMDGTVILWDLVTGSKLHALKGHKDYVSSISFSPDGTSLASGSGDRRLRVWDVVSGTLRKEYKGHTSAIEVVTYSPKGTLVATGAWDGDVRVWNIKTGQLWRDLSGHANLVEAICFLPCGNRCASASWDGTVRLWNIETGITEKLLEESTARIRSLAISSNGNHLAYGSENMNVTVWNITQDTCQTLSVAGSVRCIAFSPDEAILACGCEDSRVCWWTTKNGTRSFGRQDHAAPVRTLQFIDNDSILSGSLDGTCRVVNVRDNELTITYRGHSSCVGTVASSTTDRIMISGSWDWTIRLWDHGSNTDSENQSSTHLPAIQSLAICPDGDLVVAGSADGMIRIWNLRTNGLVLTMTDSSRAVTHVAFSTDWGKFAAVHARSEVLVSSLAIAPRRWKYQGHAESIESCCFSADGRTVAIRLKGDQIILLNASDGAVLADITNVKFNITSHKSKSMVCVTKSFSWGIEIAEVDVPEIPTNATQTWTFRLQPDPSVGFSYVSKFFSPDGLRFVFSHKPHTPGVVNTIVIRDTLYGAEIGTFTSLLWDAKTLAFATENILLACDSFARCILVLDCEARRVRSYYWRSNENVFRLAASDSYIFILMISGTSHYGIVEVLDVASGSYITQFQTLVSNPSDMIYMRPGLIAVFHCLSGQVEVWNAVDCTMIGKFKVRRRAGSGYYKFKPMRDGLIMSAGHESGSVKIWDAKDGSLKESYCTQLLEVRQLAVSTGQYFAVVGTENHNQRVWDPASQCFIPSWEAGNNLDSDPAVIQIWDRTDRSVVTIPCSILGQVEHLSFCPNDSLAIWGGHEMRIWDMYTIQQMAARINLGERLRQARSMTDVLLDLNDSILGQKTLRLEGIGYSIPVRQYKIFHNDTSACFGTGSPDHDQCGLHGTSKRTCVHASQSKTDCAIDSTNSWITYKGTRILKIPADLRTDVHCCTDDTVILGSAVGQPTILRVRPEMLKLGLEV